MKKKYKETSDINLDNIKYYYFAIPCLILSILIHPTLNHNFLTDTFWAFSMYLQAFAIFPQIQLIDKTKLMNHQLVNNHCKIMLMIIFLLILINMKLMYFGINLNNFENYILLLL